MKPEELEQIKHNHRMEELGYERETELIRLETAWRLDNTTPQEILQQQQQQYPQQQYPQQPIPQQPQYQPPTTPEEETPQEKSMKKFKGGKKK
jgi:hypothetical protein